MRIALVGYMGSGKTTVGKLLAHTLGFRFVDLDEWIERSEGCSIRELFASKGEAYFRLCESLALQKQLTTDDSVVLATGGGTPCFSNNMNILNEHFTTVYLKSSPFMIRKRLTGSEDRPLFLALNERIEEHMQSREAFYATAAYTIEGDLSAKDVCDLLMEKMSIRPE